MKYNQLTESIGLDTIQQEPYFKQFPNIKLYRGMRGIHEIKSVPFKYREQPRDTNIQIHDAVNAASIEKFGLPIRNLIFTYPEKEHTYNYGETMIVVPIGDFKLFCNPNVFDMTYYFSEFQNELEIKALVFRKVIDHLRKSRFSHEFGIEYNTKNLFDDMYDEEHRLNNNPINNLILQLIVERDSDFPVDDFDFKLRKLVSQYRIHTAATMASKQYVDDVIEITNENQLTDYDDRPPEIMVYAPNGFYVIPDHMLDGDHNEI